MAFLHQDSLACLRSELSIFDVPPTQTLVEKSSWLQYSPISALSNDSAIDFVISNNSTEYLDLSQTLLSLKVSLVTSAQLDQSEATKVEQVGPANNFMHSLFSQVDVYLNQKQASSSGNLYPYRAYIESLLSYGNSAKNSHLTSVLWCSDTPGHMEGVGPENEGLTTRRSWMGKNKCVDLIGRLHCDIFNQEKLLINGVEVRLKLVRSRPHFSIMDPTGVYSPKITEATLYIRRVKVNPSILLSHEESLRKQTAKYPLNRVEVKAISLHAGVHSESIDNFVLGTLPKRIIICFVKNKSFNGDKALNPFNFQHFNINYLSLYIDGMQIPSKPLQLDFGERKQYIEAFYSLFLGTGLHNLNQGNGISREAYNNGYTIFCFDLTPDLSASEGTHFNLVKNGSVRVDVRFEKPLEETVNCLLYLEYDSILEIDSSRQIITDF